MSRFYRCDKCGVEAPDPGHDYSAEEPIIPTGWRVGPGGDFCPVHPMRIADGEMFSTPVEGSGYHDTGEEPAKVVGYEPATGMYAVVWWPESAGAVEQEIHLPAADVEECFKRQTGVRWIPIPEAA